MAPTDQTGDTGGAERPQVAQAGAAKPKPSEPLAESREAALEHRDFESIGAALSLLTDKASTIDLDDEELAQEIASLLAIGNRIRSLGKTHSTEMIGPYVDAVKLAVGAHPNPVVIRRLVNQTTVLYHWKKSRLMRWIYLLGRGRPGNAALAGLLMSFISSLILGGLFVWVLEELSPFLFGTGSSESTSFWISTAFASDGTGDTAEKDTVAIFMSFRDVMTLTSSAFLGSVASIVASMTKQSGVPEAYDAGRIFTNAFLKPLIAMIFAIAVFSTLKAGLVTIPGFDHINSSAVAGSNAPGNDEKYMFTLWVIGFLSGFSERFAPKIFEQVGVDKEPV